MMVRIVTYLIKYFSFIPFTTLVSCESGVVILPHTQTTQQGSRSSGNSNPTNNMDIGVTNPVDGASSMDPCAGRPFVAGCGGMGGSNLNIAGFDRRLRNYFTAQKMTITPRIFNPQGRGLNYIWNNQIVGPNGVSSKCLELSEEGSEVYEIECAVAGTLTVSLTVIDSLGSRANRSFTFSEPVKNNPISNATWPQVQNIMNNRCASCHVNGTAPRWTLNNEMAFRSGRVSPGDAESSTLVIKLTGWGFNGNMPTSTTTLSDNEVATIISWIESL